MKECEGAEKGGGKNGLKWKKKKKSEKRELRNSKRAQTECGYSKIS